MLLRVAASFVFVMMVFVAAQAQEGQRPSQEAQPPSQDGPPPSKDEDDREGAPRIQEPPPRAEGTPPRQQEPRAEIRPSGRCGAVAYTADGAFGAAYGIDTCEDAERLAIDECRRESTNKGDCSRGVIRRTSSWFHIQFCRRDGQWSTHVTARSTLAETNEAAAQFARRSRYGAENCRMVPNGLFHSGGLHTKM